MIIRQTQKNDLESISDRIIRTMTSGKQFWNGMPTVGQSVFLSGILTPGIFICTKIIINSRNDNYYPDSAPDYKTLSEKFPEKL